MKSTEELEQSNREAEQLRLRYAKRRHERKAKLEEYAKKVRQADQLLEDIQREFPKKWAKFPYSDAVEIDAL